MDSDELNELIKNYQPKPAVLEAIKDIHLVATVGPSASGKSSLMKALIDKYPEFYLVLANTERPKRPNEEHGVDLIFRSRQEILEDLKNGQLVQAVVGPSHIYATRPDSFSKKGIGLIPLVPAGVKQFRQLPVASFKVTYIVPDSYEHWRQWLNKQAQLSQWTPQQIQHRLAEAKESLEFALADPELHFILNDEVERGAQRLWQVAKGHKPDDEEYAQELVKNHYQRLLKEL